MERRRWFTGRVKLGTRAHRTLAYATAAVTLAASAVVLTALNSEAVTNSPSGFESSDGNMTLDTSGGANTDWNCFIGSDGFQSGTPSTDCKVTSGAIHTSVTTNTTWVNGQKFDALCPKLSTGNTPAKDTFTDIGTYSELGTDDHVYFYGSTIRSSANGNSSGDVEFNQKQQTTDVTVAPCRTAGDKLVAYDYLSGGSTLDFHVLTWIDNSDPGTSDKAGGNNGTCFVKTSSMPCWGAKVFTPDGADFDGEANQSPITGANNGMSAKDLVTNQFAEFGTDLTDALGLSGCTRFPQQVWESRSSGSSFTSNPQAIQIVKRTIQTCGEIKIIKQTDPRGQDQSFSFASNLPANADAGGVTCAGKSASGINTDHSFCLNDTGNSSKTLSSPPSGAGTDNSAGNTITATNVPHGSYSVTEAADSGAFNLSLISCSATTGSSGAVDGTNDHKVNISLLANGTVTCIFVNRLHSGAITITKNGKWKNCTAALTPTITNAVCTGAATAKLGGAQFKVYSDSTTTTQVGSTLTTSSSGTDTGTVCIDGLPWSTGGTNYYVKETGAPTGYALPASVTNTVGVSANATCATSSAAATGTSATTSFTDAPLTDLSISVTSQRAGATKSSISCTGSNNTIARVPASGVTDPASLSATGLKPDTLTCTIVIDP